VTSSNRRQRELARAKFERQQARRAARRRHRKRNQVIIAVVVVAALVLSFGGWVVFSAVGKDSTDEPVAEASAGPVDSCTGAIQTTASPQTFASAPPADSTIATGTTITFTTNCGPIVVQTLPKLAPKTVASEVFLSGQGYYDQTPCHRLTTEGIYVLQCGDPTGTGQGGPGYTVPDENLPAKTSTVYRAGTVAMANAGSGTSGSQFFIVYQDSPLGPDYTVWGKVTSGLDVVKAVAAAGVADGSSDGAPLQPVVIEQATVSRS